MHGWRIRDRIRTVYVQNVPFERYMYIAWLHVLFTSLGAQADLLAGLDTPSAERGELTKDRNGVDLDPLLIVESASIRKVFI